MNINNFEEYFDNVILNRGLDYYKCGNIISLELNPDSGEWVAEVEGSEDYTVTAILSDKGEITDTDCDCPYDYNIHCKHQAAVFYAIREELQKKPKKLKKKSTQQKNLEVILNDLDKQALVSLLLEFAKKDRRIKEELLLRYATQSDVLESARNVIKGSIKAVKRQGYVEYHDTRKAVKGAETALELAENKSNSGEVLTALKLCVIILEEMKELLNYCYDSTSEPFGVIEETVALIGNITEKIYESKKDSEKYFDIIFSHAINDNNCMMSLLYILIPMCDNSANRSKIEQFIAVMITLTTSDSDYSNKRFQRLQFDIIQAFDDNEAVVDYIENHLNNSEFRKIAITNSINAKQYDRALNLCLEGEEKDSDHVGLLGMWKEFRYSIYEQTKEKTAQIEIATEFVLDGKFDYFLKLKKFHKKNEWESVVKSILAKIGNNRRGIYVQILIEEKLKSLILEYCKSDVQSIKEHYAHLLPEYKSDVIALFEQYIKYCSQHADNRSKYRGVCDIIRVFKKACGSKLASAICEELKQKYPKRPAFLDELGKV